MDTSERLEALLSPVAESSGLLLEEVAVVGPPRQRVVRVVLDLPDGPGGVTSDQIAEASRAISAALDATDEVQGSYTLEVTTPGATRPLTLARHFRRAQGRLVTLTTAQATMTGRLAAVEGDNVHLEHDGTTTVVPLTDITQGRIELEMRRLEE